VTQIPAGWYPDPTPAQDQAGPSLRWWDGGQWTEHVAATPPVAYPAQPYQPAYPAQPYVVPPATTPDGQPLAGWWRRVGASFIDGIILFPVIVLIGLPFLIPMTQTFADEWDQAMDDIDSGGSSQAFGADFQSEILWYSLGFALVALVVGAAYEIGFLRWKQATPGKMALGIEVRLRERPGTLPWGCLFRRWFVKNLGNFVAQIPFVGGFLNLAWLVNFLWPLWDDKKQALHDKAAQTNVVRRR